MIKYLALSDNKNKFQVNAVKKGVRFMFKKEIRKKVLLAVLFALTAFTVTGCGTSSETSGETPAETVIATEAETSAPEETTAEEASVPEETIAEETSAPEETTAEETSAPEEAGSVLTNAELLNMINKAFGMMTDNTFEGDCKTASDWDIIDADAEIQPDEEITPEFLISASMRATGFVTGSSSMDEILTCAAERGVILINDISAVDVKQASDIVDKAKYAWTHQEIKTEIKVELCDGVLDLTETIPAESVKIDGNTIEIPAEYAKDITEGTVYILPKNADGQGGAYKAQSVEENGATVIIKSVPAELQEVYKSISSN